MEVVAAPPVPARMVPPKPEFGLARLGALEASAPNIGGLGGGGGASGSGGEDEPPDEPPNMLGHHSFVAERVVFGFHHWFLWMITPGVGMGSEGVGEG